MLNPISPVLTKSAEIFRPYAKADISVIGERENTKTRVILTQCTSLFWQRAETSTLKSNYLKGLQGIATVISQRNET
ncbi:hypothetical protein ACTXT7_004458 [Hymenolepis weldensis]